MRPTHLARRPGCPAPILLEYHAAGDPPSRSLELHLPGCEDCRREVATLAAEAAAFRAARPTARFIAKLEARAAHAKRRPWAWWLSAATAAALVAFVALRPDERPRTKGSGGLSVFVSRGATGPAQLVQSGNSVKPGDALRFVFVPSAAGHVMVLDLDGSGRLTVFSPFGAAQSTAISPGAPRPLPETVALDASPGPERIVAVFRPEPFTLADVQRWLRTDGPTPHLDCPDCTAQWVVLNKP